MDFLDFLPLFLRSFLAKVKEVIKVMMKNIYKNFFIKCSVFLFMKNIYIINLLKLNQNKFKNSFEFPCHSPSSLIIVTVYFDSQSPKNVNDLLFSLFHLLLLYNKAFEKELQSLRLYYDDQSHKNCFLLNVMLFSRPIINIYIYVLFLFMYLILKFYFCFK